ncbi:Nn.00g063650.m01.CDS01 [Neocucurbitaria sp. VM-36]
MSSNCHTCRHRIQAVTHWPSAPSQLDVCIVKLAFKIPITQTQTEVYVALNTLLNNIIDNEESIARPSTFTVWSPSLSDPRTVVIVTTVSNVCSISTSPIFDALKKYLVAPPTVQHVYLDLAVLSLAAASPEQRVHCDLLQLHAPDPSVAVAIGKQFGWHPQRSSISSQLQKCATATFSRPGDLIRDFWAWAEVSHSRSRSASESTGSSSLSSPSVLSLHYDQHNTTSSTPDEREHLDSAEGETLIMLFQWTSHADAERFKDYSQKSYGPNGEAVNSNLWRREVAYPFEQLQHLGAKADSYKLELRAVEPRIYTGADANTQIAVREKSRIRRLSNIASGFGEKVSGLWR